MILQEFLRNGGTLEDLALKYAIKNRRHNVYKNLVLLKYDQINSPMSEPAVKEARGVILDQNDNWSVVCRPFDKFFNQGEGHAAKIDWDTARVQQKYDGSLCTLYHYDNKWHVATTGTPDACGQVNDFGITFADLFWAVWDEKRYELPIGWENFSFMFELMCPENRVVVQHKHRNLVLIGVRHRSGAEMSLDSAAGLDYSYAQKYPLQSIEDVLKTFEAMNPLNQEGYVIVDRDFNRIKVKHPGYLALHHMKGNGLTNKRIVEIVRSGEYSEVVSYFPEWKDKLDEVSGKLFEFQANFEDYYERIQEIESQKEFAAFALKTPLPDLLFRLRKKQVNSVKEYIMSMRLENLVSVLGLKDNQIEAIE